MAKKVKPCDSAMDELMKKVDESIGVFVTRSILRLCETSKLPGNELIAILVSVLTFVMYETTTNKKLKQLNKDADNVKKALLEGFESMIQMDKDIKRMDKEVKK